MRSHMEEVAKIFGVELGEVFKVTDDDSGKYHNYYRFTEKKGIEVSEDNVKWEADTAGTLVLKWLLIGVARIIKLPWKPQEGDSYYFPCPASIEKWDYSTWSEREVDYYRLNHGFVCKTMEEAIAMSRRMLAIAIMEEREND